MNDKWMNDKLRANIQEELLNKVKTLTISEFCKDQMNNMYLVYMFEDSLLNAVHKFINTSIVLKNFNTYISMRHIYHFVYSNNLQNKTVEEIATLFILLYEKSEK